MYVYEEAEWRSGIARSGIARVLITHETEVRILPLLIVLQTFADFFFMPKSLDAWNIF